MNAKDKVTAIKGVGPKKSDLLSKLGIYTVEDLFLHYPRNYEDRRTVTPVCDMKDGMKALVRARVTHMRKNGFGRNQNVYLTCEDETGTFEALFFHAGFIANTVRFGEYYDFYGTCENNGRRRMLHPSFRPADDRNRGIIPVYPLTKGISNSEMINLQRRISEDGVYIEDYLPEDVRRRNNLCDIRYALSNVHFPEDRRKLSEARYRIVFDELLIVQLGILMMKAGRNPDGRAISFSSSVDEGEYIDSLPYALTNAQRRTVSEIMDDMESSTVMNRLVQGDVGSGKTAVAQIAMYKAVKSGYQAVLMAPTEILARQHFEDIRKSFEPFGIRCGFLGGRMKAAERKECIKEVQDGSVDVLIGTHAVISDDVVFSRLGLVITDEQHRFGVNQRALLGKKGEHPDRLVMTATPIPRTLAVVIYGDLDISIIDELPKGRKPVATEALDEKERDRAYDYLECELKNGRQGYVVTPLIEENEETSLKSVDEVYRELRDRFSGFEVEMLHGEMKPQLKDEIMERFRLGEIQVLVSTVVIEVGINVPNATVMVIENAERFGLAQLHQLRGRVGRGALRSKCFVITGGKSETARERADIMEKSNDGFYIAEQDLKLRGPGDIFGIRQHGLPDMKMADMARHVKVLKKAGDEARYLINNYEYFCSSECDMLRNKVSDMFGQDMTFNL